MSESFPKSRNSLKSENFTMIRNILWRRNKFLQKGYNYVVFHDNMEETCNTCSSTAPQLLQVGFYWACSGMIVMKYAKVC